MPDRFVHDNSLSEYSFLHIVDEQIFSMDFHCHNFIEIYLSISGGKHFIINDKMYDIHPGDLFISNNYEVHRVITFENVRYERYVLEYKPAFALPFCTPKVDLLHYVYNRPVSFSNKISLRDKQMDIMLELFRRYEGLDDSDYGSDIIKQLYFVEMLTAVAGFFNSASKEKSNASMEYKGVIAPLLEFIGEHLTEDLSLDRLAGHISISKHHLCKLFKKNTGTTVNRYVVTRRVARAKELLARGFSVTAACEGAGFNDISHFIRTFHRLTGVSPSKYVRQEFYVNELPDNSS